MQGVTDLHSVLDLATEERLRGDLHGKQHHISGYVPPFARLPAIEHISSHGYDIVPIRLDPLLVKCGHDNPTMFTVQIAVDVKESCARRFQLLYPFAEFGSCWVDGAEQIVLVEF